MDDLLATDTSHCTIQVFTTTYPGNSAAEGDKPADAEAEFQLAVLNALDIVHVLGVDVVGLHRRERASDQ